MHLLAHVGTGTFDQLQLGSLLLVLVVYVVRVRELGLRGRPVPGARQASFVAGVLVIAASLASPVAHIGEELFLAHMAQHLLMTDAGALLMVLGLTGPVLAPLLRRRPIAALRVLAHPLVAFPAWLANLYLWHLPAAYQATLASDPVHALMHGMFIATGALIWMPLFGPLPKPEWFGTAAKALYVVALRLGGAVLANVLLWAESPLYPAYGPGWAYWGIDPLSDQGTAGAIMMIEQSVLTLFLFGWLFLRWAREQEEEQELIERAQRGGVALEPVRARRAVAAGRGSELRERLDREAGLSSPR